jgi:pantetheine-phosphate adenylyltransferase
VATTAIYAGSFDPITRGHEDLIRRSCEFVDHLVVAVAVNSSKKALFTIDERVELIRAATADNKQIEVTSFEGLLVDFARKVGAKFNIRGLRAVSDFEYEFQMALMNRHMSESFETIFGSIGGDDVHQLERGPRSQHHGNLNGL